MVVGGKWAGPVQGLHVTKGSPRPRGVKREATDEFESSRMANETIGQPMDAAVGLKVERAGLAPALTA